MSGFTHIPVMLEECLQGLNVRDGGIYFDGTIGGGGHSYEILKRSAPSGRLIATDLDDDAIAAASARLAEFDGRFKIFKSDYKNFEEVLEKANVDKPSAPLDMRMDRSQSLSAETVVNEYSAKELAKILKEYGEEKFASAIAANIAKARENKRITTCGELSAIIEESIPKKFQQNGPAARKSFQAIRIAVNGELSGLYDCVTGLTRRLKKGGRIAILTFHSLEDRIVKQAFKYLEQSCICDKSLPVCVCGKKKEIELITKKPIVASVKEMTLNTRSKCAKLRIAEKII